MVTPLAIGARQVRLPPQVREAIAQHRDVRVEFHDAPRFVIMHPDDYAMVVPLLERARRGLPVPVTDLLDEDDFAILEELRNEDEGLDEGILGAWG